VQDAFARLLTHWNKVDDVALYLRRSVVNGGRDVQRRRAVARRVGLPRRSEAVEPESDELRDALRTLSSRQRTALVLKFYVDLSTADIAKVMGVREGTVKSLVHRGLAELRKVVE
jgi:RNA polymerase sigma factor (sigma-70 family)